MKHFFLFCLLGCLGLPAFAQNNEIQPDTFRFVTVKALPITPVKNQANTGTCWAFSGS